MGSRVGVRGADRNSKRHFALALRSAPPWSTLAPPLAATPCLRLWLRAQHPRRSTPEQGDGAAPCGLDRRRRLESGRAARGNTGRRTWERGSATTFRVINGTDGQSHKCTVTATFSDGDILQADIIVEVRDL